MGPRGVMRWKIWPWEEKARMPKRMGASTGTFKVEREQQENKRSHDERNELHSIGHHQAALLHLLPQFVGAKNVSFIHGAMCLLSHTLNLRGGTVVDLNPAWLPHSSLLVIDLGGEVGKWPGRSQIYITEISAEDIPGNYFALWEMLPSLNLVRWEPDAWDEGAIVLPWGRTWGPEVNQKLNAQDGGELWVSG